MTHQQPPSETKPHPCRCETCKHHIGKMVNFFGLDQPFCKNPKIVEANKNKPETGGMITPNHYRIEDHRIMKGDLYFLPMSEFQVQAIRTLGCASHSAANTGAQTWIDAVVKELEEMKSDAKKRSEHAHEIEDGKWCGCNLTDRPDAELKVLGKAIALLKGVGK